MIVYVLFFQMFGLSQRFNLVHWVGTPLVVCTTIIVSPIAGVCDVLFRMTFSLLTSVGIVRQSRPISLEI